MATTTGNKKYVQPYSSRYVTSNTVDPIRADEPPYIRNFPRFLYQIYEKQTAFSLTIMGTFKQANVRKSKSASRKSVSTRSPNVRGQQDQSGFRTMGQSERTTKSPQNAVAAVPSDFEHIFHYSEAN